MPTRVYAQQGKVMEVENEVSTAKGDAGAWTKAVPGQPVEVRDRIKTGEYSRTTVRLTDAYSLRIEELTSMRLLPAAFADGKPKLDLPRGAAFIFSREKSGEINLSTPATLGGLTGTQLFVRVEDSGKTTLQVFEGSVDLSNPAGRWTLKAGEAGEISPGQPLRRTAALEPASILQWALYYPAVIDPAGLALADDKAIAGSLAAYRSGDLLEALERYPDHEPRTVDGRLYRAGVTLAVGRVDDATRQLQGCPANHPGRRALERMISTVKGEVLEPWPLESLNTTAEAIAESYYRQSRAELKESRAAALRATELAPENGFAWTRLAELEFSRGDSRGAQASLAKALEFTPRNAQAFALQGFVFSAENCMAQARESFEHAIQLDGALGNGWLGLGLVKIKAGDLSGGRADLQIAATVEPTTSVFHSYLGKAFGMEDRPVEARKDLDLARSLDRHDPTPWLYSALELQRNNQTNAAIADLQESLARNDNRRIYRSSLLLDQDRAVRSANLARIYQAAGMREVSVREATRAVESDYTNPSAHLFLANSFDALRDPERVSLRYETPWFNELLLSNLLSPVGGGPLSQFVSQQEYSKLLESDGLGGSLTSEWRSDSEVRTTASLFGTYGKVSFGIDAYYRDDTGDRVNSEFTLEELYGQFKWQPGPDDTFYFLGKWGDQQSGDNTEYYDDRSSRPYLDFEENQDPGLLLGGWNHRWGPGSHTLFLAGRLAAKQRLLDPASGQLLVERDRNALIPGFIQINEFESDEFTDPALRALYPSGTIDTDAFGNPVYSQALLRAIEPFLGLGEIVGDPLVAPFDFSTTREFDILTAEIQHILQTEWNTFLAGTRWQSGDITTRARLVLNPEGAFVGGFPTPASEQYSTTEFDRLSVYAYDYWRAARHLTLIGGVTWDHLDHPENFRNPPVTGAQRTDKAWSGKFGFTCDPAPWLVVRGAYTEGLGGVTFDESVRLEPVQLAGFNQAFRTAISESIAGSVEAPRYKTWGLSAEGQLPTRTWWGAAVQGIDQNVDRSVGIFTGYALGVFPSLPSYFADQTSQRLDYRETSGLITLNQLLGEEFAVGASYRATRSELRTTFTGLYPDSSLPGLDVRERATLHEFSLHGDWYSPTGFFARVEANLFSQDLADDPRAPVQRRGDEFWHFNALAGYRFNDNLCELSAGILNIGNTGYQLSPLNPRGELVQGRTAVVRCRLAF
jgi:tetratricopeptide (TPR) repeat protein/outer membrane receptor protein involved in Fe transport